MTDGARIQGGGLLAQAWAILRPPAVDALYGMLGTRAFTAQGLWLNLGHWREARSIEEACPALALLLAEAAAIGPDDTVVDVGFGFADQDMLWAKRFAPRRITGLNVTPLHVRLGRVRVRRAGLGDTIDLREGSATAMPLPDESCDVVTALECAFHFDTRADFLAEAFRVLRPGGRIALADIIPAAQAGGALRRRWQAASWRALARALSISDANADTQQTYAARFAAAGFDAVEVRSIGAEVFPGFHQALREDAAFFARLPASARIAYRPLLRFEAGAIYAGLDYVLATARKPFADGRAT
ncbi:class I SAM-dependent methyltransferase [Roseomonas fluvialis]|nr:class I SAM-dependent methyltransferase [Roseomonas fluvialis]